MELWDAYDEDFRKIPGASLVRGEEIPEGLFHLVCDVLVRHTDGSYLLMRRDPRKHKGGLWEATAGGAALQGESPIECAARELCEETGIRSDSLVELGRVKGRNVIYVEYLCVTDCHKDNIVLQEGETVAYRWVSGSELVDMKQSELAASRILAFIPELQ